MNIHHFVSILSNHLHGGVGFGKIEPGGEDRFSEDAGHGLGVKVNLRAVMFDHTVNGAYVDGVGLVVDENDTRLGVDQTIDDALNQDRLVDGWGAKGSGAWAL